MKVKVCGMKHNIEEIMGLGPDYLGFIFWPGSARYFEGQIPQGNTSIEKVGVFVDATTGFINEKVQEYALDLVQLHGLESPGFCRGLKESLRGTSVRLIKVFSVKESFDFKLLQDYEEVCDFFLFDTRGKLPGGNGFAFDWKLLEGYPSAKPFFLSGGIGPDSLEAIKDFMKRPEAQHCHAIDVNSRFEAAPGRKKPGVLINFIKSIKESHNL